VLTTNQKGVIAEVKIATAAILAGVGVARPLDDERYDLISEWAIACSRCNASGRNSRATSSLLARTRAAVGRTA
jgi:hypothetical protein